MPTSYTTSLGLALPATGELTGTWGTIVNDNITQYLESALAGALTLSTDADVTLTRTTNAALGATSSQYAILNCTGARTVQRTITVPATTKTYIVINATTGGFGVKVVGAGPTTGVVVPAGKRYLLAWNGSDFVAVVSGPVALTSDVSGVLPQANGGTGLSSPGALNNVLYSDGTNWVAGPLPSASAVSSFSAGTTGLTPGSPTTGNIVLAGTLAVANGGTGLSSTPTNGQLDIGNGTGFTRATLTAGTGIGITNGAGSITISNTSSGAPALNVVTGTTQTAVAGNQYVLTNAAASTLTLPASPSAGDVVWVTVGNSRTDNVVARNSQNIMGLAENMTLNNQYVSVQLRFVNSSLGWRMV